MEGGGTSVRSRPAQPTASWGPWVAVARSSGQVDLPSALHYHWGPPKSAPSGQPSPSAWSKKKGRGQEGELREGGGRGREEGNSREFTKEGGQRGAGRRGAGAPAQPHPPPPAQTCLEMHPHPPPPRSSPSVQRDRQIRARPWGGGGGSCCWGRETLSPSLP